MKKYYTIICTLLISLFSLTASRNANAQLIVDTSVSVPTMLHDFFDGTCVSIDNVTYTGSNIATGFFDASGTPLGINAGIIMTSGTIYNAVGPNNTGGVSTDNSYTGDADLSVLSGQPTYNAAVIEMDITPSVDTLFFIYSFGSDEYMDWVGTPFNDVFGFYVSGPGITGTENIALVPGSLVPVTINNINCTVMNQQYYVCNDPYDLTCFTSDCHDSSGNATLQYDGFTKLLTAQIVVIPDSTYHVKLAISDAADAVFDSGILIGVQSLCGDGFLKPVAEFLSQVGDLTASFENKSKYATTYEWDFGDGITSTDENPVHVYASPGLYDVKLTVHNYCCSDVYVLPVQVGTATGVQNIEEAAVSIFPNPSTGIITIQLDNANQGLARIFDYAGRELSQLNIESNTTIDLSSYQKGLLFIEVIVDDKVFLRKLELK